MRDMVMFLLAITSSSSYAAVLFFSQRIFSRGQRITPGDAMSEAPEGLPLGLLCGHVGKHSLGHDYSSSVAYLPSMKRSRIPFG